MGRIAYRFALAGAIYDSIGFTTTAAIVVVEVDLVGKVACADPTHISVAS